MRTCSQGYNVIKMPPWLFVQREQVIGADGRKRDE